MPATHGRTALSALCVAAVFILLLAVPFPAGAQDKESTPGWHPHGPEKDMKDWVQLKSGEWLRGEIELFRDLKMDFDSDELDDLQLDWDDIIAFRTPREMTFVFSRDRVYTGSASMRDGMIRINTAGGVREVHRRELLSVIEGSPRERNFWSVKANIGYTQRTGNTEQIDLATRIFVKREAVSSRLSLDSRGDYSENSGTETINKHQLSVRADLFISRKVYVTPASYEYYTDKFQNIDYRNTVGAGMGYFFFRRKDIEWSVGMGGGYQVTVPLSIEAGEDPKEKTGAVIPSSDLEWDITDDIELDISYSSRLGVPDIKNSTHHVAMDLSFDIYRDIFEITFTMVWDRVDSPTPFEDGTIPKKDDTRLVFGFGIDL